MILSGTAIVKAVGSGEIIIDPFDPSHVGSNSYDFRLGHRCVVYDRQTLDSRQLNRYHEIEFTSDGLLLQTDTLYLFNTLETMGSNYYVPIIRGRSSVGRLGLFINITADLIDIGSINQWTLQLHCIQPIRVYPEMRIGQVTFWTVYGEITLYEGKYGRMPSPVPSLSYVDSVNPLPNDGK